MTTHPGAVETLQPVAIPMDMPVPCDGKQMPGRLGVFQRAMLQWNNLHPYNAVHVARIAGALDREKLEDAARGVLENAGLTGLVVDQRQHRFHYRGGPARVSLEVLSDGDVHAGIANEMRAQLNAPFPLEGPFTPVRFFAAADGGSFYLGAAYCHFISDADPIVRLVGAIAQAYNGTAASASNSWDPYPSMRRYLLPLILKSAPWFVAGLPRFAWNMSRSAKARYAERPGRANGFELCTIGKSQFAQLAQASRSWGVTLNDVFLAALAKAVRPLAIKRATGRKRDRIAVSSIASIRKDLPDGAADKMAPFLGSYAVFQPLSRDDSLEATARSIHAQSAAIKKRKLYLRTIVDLIVSGAMMRHASDAWREKFFRQNYPLWGGVSSLNLSSMSDRMASAGISGYLRAVSTGPACPLVLSITTHDGALSVGVSYRTAVFTPEAIEGVVSRFSGCLGQPLAR
jgi:hypothetical protein